MVEGNKATRVEHKWNERQRMNNKDLCRAYYRRQWKIAAYAQRLHLATHLFKNKTQQLDTHRTSRRGEKYTLLVWEMKIGLIAAMMPISPISPVQWFLRKIASVSLWPNSSGGGSTNKHKKIYTCFMRCLWNGHVFYTKCVMKNNTIQKCY